MLDDDDRTCLCKGPVVQMNTNDIVKYVLPLDLTDGKCNRLLSAPCTLTPCFASVTPKAAIKLTYQLSKFRPQIRPFLEVDLIFSSIDQLD